MPRRRVVATACGVRGAGSPESRGPEFASSPHRHTPSPEEALPAQRGAAGAPRGASSVEERWGDRAQVTGPEKDGAARGGGGGSGRRQRGSRWGPEQQAERGEPGRQRRGNEKQTQIGECSRRPRRPWGQGEPRGPPAVDRGGTRGPLPRATATSLYKSGSRSRSGHAEARRRRGGGRAPPAPLNPFLPLASLGGTAGRRKAPPQLGETPSPGQGLLFVELVGAKLLCAIPFPSHPCQLLGFAS